MLTKVIEIGRLMKHTDLYRNFTKPIKHGTGLALRVGLEPIEYKGVVVLETPRSDQVHLLLYTDQMGNVSGKSPTVTLSVGRNKPEEIRKNIEKTFQRFQRFFQGEEATKDLEKLLAENYERIIKDIEEQIASMSEKSTYLTIILLKGNEELKPAEYEPLREVFVRRALEKTISTGVEGICHFCGRSKVVSATVNEVFKFATFDKPGFCPNLKKEDAIKILPICEDCKTNLQNGANVVTQDLKFDFLGNTIWLIPSLINKDDSILRRVIEKVKENSVTLKDFARNEEEIETALADQDEIVHYDFLFMDINKNQQRIELHLTEVSPTRLRKLVTERREAARRTNIENLPEPTLRLLWELYEKPNSRSEARKEYFQLIRSIFYGETYNPHRFLWYCMRKIRKALQEDSGEPGWRTLSYLSFAAILFLNQIGVFHTRKEVELVNNNELNGFFEKYPEFFNKPWKRAVFLTGVLAGKVLAVQYVKRQAAPFFSKLKGLKMNIRDVQGLLPEIRNKLEQYRSYGQRTDLIMKAAAEYYLSSNERNIAIDELNFVFTLGLAYSNKEPFKAEVEEVVENEEQV
ncbi:MAG: TIGR02556 family CRISPR-associated protein [Pseudothermotoga sp.]|uniref:TIGR02556 family CRISPR-associated protein n=1 Tax=Pseudothermotoga sp. TaxID=2033661 RepID=UPI000AF4C11C|nr:TIGR02556 family CRISPR-associated protein [Pseudothermotoga sp.]